MVAAEAPLQGRRWPGPSATATAIGDGDDGVLFDLNRVGERRRGLAHFNLNQVTRSARTTGALRLILPVGHGDMMRYGYVDI
jgi:hypothetical protein